MKHKKVRLSVPGVDALARLRALLPGKRDSEIASVALLALEVALEEGVRDIPEVVRFDRGFLVTNSKHDGVYDGVAQVNARELPVQVDSPPVPALESTTDTPTPVVETDFDFESMF